MNTKYPHRLETWTDSLFIYYLWHVDSLTSFIERFQFFFIYDMSIPSLHSLNGFDFLFIYGVTVKTENWTMQKWRGCEQSTNVISSKIIEGFRYFKHFKSREYNIYSHFYMPRTCHCIFVVYILWRTDLTIQSYFLVICFPPCCGRKL